MDESARDERMRHLQRVAYGAVASDTERAAALSELEALRREQAAATEASAVSSGVEATPPGVEAAPRPTLEASAPEMFAHRGADPARPVKWAIAAGTAALLLGVAVGWSVGARMPVAEPATMDQALGSAVSVPVGPGEVVSVPTMGSPAYAVFDRPAAQTDAIAAEIPADWIDAASLRLLATTPEGLAVYAAKALERETPDVCILVVRPNAGVGASCTVNGLFEQGRLSADHYLHGEGLVVATWHADGSVQVGARAPVVRAQ